LEPVLDSLDADMLGLLARAEQGRVKVIKGEHYVPGPQEPEVVEIGEEDKKRLQARLTGTSFKLKLGEAGTWRRTTEDFSRRIGEYLSSKKRYRILVGPDTAVGNNHRAVSACLRLMDTVYVWTPGCNCPKPKSSALATCAVVLDVRAADSEKRAIWGKQEILFYVGLDESMDEVFSGKRIRKYVRDAFKSFD
jgi:hypothetical protein